jgi:hypothetical protein
MGFTLPRFSGSIRRFALFDRDMHFAFLSTHVEQSIPFKATSHRLLLRKQ